MPIIISSFRHLVSSLILLGCLLPSVNCLASDSNNEKAKQRNSAKLNDVQQAIAKQESNIFKTNKARSVLEKQLKDDDLAIAKVAKAINDTEQLLNNTQQEISSLSKEKQKLTSQKITQEQLLAKQLRSAYTTGQHDYLKLLLNQQQSEKFSERLLIINI